jgi:hypothetical protein
MQQFTMMILYNPMVCGVTIFDQLHVTVVWSRKQSETIAKSSRRFVTFIDISDPMLTNGLQKFKSDFDLFANAVPTSQSMRQTRRRLNERRQILLSPSAAARPSPKKKQKTNARNTEELWNVVSSSKKLGKAKEESVFEKEQDIKGQNKFLDRLESSESPSLSTAQETVFVRRKGGIARAIQSREASLSPPASGGSVGPATKKRRRDDSPGPATVPLAPHKIHDEGAVIQENGMKENVYPPIIYGESISTRAGKRAGKLRDVSLLKRPPDSTKSQV